MNIQELKDRLIELNSEAHEIYAKAEAEKRDLSVEETTQIDRILESSEVTQQNIDRLQKLGLQTENLAKPTGRKTAPETPRVPAEEEENLAPVPVRRIPAEPYNPVRRRTGGFESLGHFGMAVANACRNGGRMDARLEQLASATTFGNEGAGADGGFAVPPEFRANIMVAINGEDSLLSRCDQITCTGNTFTQPFDETTPWQTSGGILANWDGEAAAATQSKPQIQERVTKLNKLRVLVPLSEEIIEDAAAMDSYLNRKAPQKIAFKINNALINGTGVGQPLGVMNSPAKITVTKESGQVTGGIIAANIQKMYNRMYGGCRQNAVWVYNQEIEPQLFKLSQPGTDNTGNAVTTWGAFMFIPPGAMSAGPYGTLMGRPMIPSQACAALSTEGDIIFVAWDQYLALLKSGPNPKVDVSMHLWFDQDLTAFKFSLRMGGIPWWSAAASPLNGSNTYSPYITLQTR